METYTDAPPGRINPFVEYAKIVDILNLGHADMAYERARHWVQNEPQDLSYFACAHCLYVRAWKEKDAASRKSLTIEALMCLDKVLGDGCVSPWSMTSFRGILFTFVGKDEEGERLLDKAFLEDPGDEWLLNRYGEYLYEKKKCEKLKDMSCAALSLNPKSITALYYLMWLAYDEKKYAEALEISEQILKIDPNYASPYCLRARIAFSEGRFADYEKHSLEALRLDPTLATTKYFEAYDKECVRIKKERKGQKITYCIAVAIGLIMAIVSPDTRSTRSYTPSSSQTVYHYNTNTPRYKPLTDITVVKPLPVMPHSSVNFKKLDQYVQLKKLSKIPVMKHEIKLPKFEPVKLPEIKSPEERIKALCLHFEKHNLAPPSYCINEPSQKELAERR